MKKLSLAIIAGVFLLTMACSKGESGSTASGQSVKNPADKPVASTGASKPPKLNLHWMVPIYSAEATLPSADQDFVKKTIDEKFNVDLKIDYMVIGSDYTNKLNVMLAGGDVPDMFAAAGADSQKYITDGLVADLTPYVTQQSMPNYFKWIKPEELTAFQTKDMKFGRAILPFMRKSTAAFYIRQDWLDKFGLKQPQGMDELLNVMRKFTNDDPDGNGKKDTYGFTTAGNGNGITFDFPQWQANGYIADFQIANNRFVDNRTDLGVQKVVQGIIDMNNEGVVDPDWFLNKGSADWDKAAQGKIGVMFSRDNTFALASIPTSVQARNKELDPKANWQPINPFPNTKAYWKNGVPESAFMAGKSVAEKKPENIERSMQILDWLASDEGFLLTHYGIEGTHYSKEGNKITLIPDAFNKDITENGDWLSVYNFFIPEEPSVLGYELIDPRISERDQAILKTIASYPSYDALPPVTLSPPAGMNIGDLRKEMNRLHVKMIFEDKSAAKWPIYREDLMTKFHGKDIFQGYTDQINAVLSGTKLDAFQ